MRYTREQIEHLLWRQLENIVILNDNILLLKEQARLLNELNQKLQNKLDEGKPKLKIYSTARRRYVKPVDIDVPTSISGETTSVI